MAGTAMRTSVIGLAAVVFTLAWASVATGSQIAQIPPDEATRNGYRGLLAAVARGDLEAIERYAQAGHGVDVRDGHGRTPLMVAAHRGDHAAAIFLISAGADVDALDHDRYDALTIAGVRGDLKMVQVALDAKANPGQVTSRYDGTALIASAHLGHVDVVRALIAAGAPLDHVNNLGWTAPIEAIVLGDGGPRHTQILADFLAAGANPNLADGSGTSPLRLARSRGYDAMVKILIQAGARE
jgi:ankyrin repeat protein